MGTSAKVGSITLRILTSKKWSLPQVGVDFAFGQTLDKNFDPSVGQFEHAHDRGDGADSMDVCRSRIFLGGIFLRDEENQTIARKRLFDRADRNVAPDKQRQHHVRVNDNVANRQKRQDIRNLDLRSPLSGLSLSIQLHS